MPSGDLDKYEYLTGEDLNYKRSTVAQAEFDYSQLSKFFDKELKDEDKKEVLLKKLKNIEGKNQEQLKVLKYQAEKQTVISKVKNPNFNKLSHRNSLVADSMKMFNEINKLDETIDYLNLNFIGSFKKYTFNFKDFMSLGSRSENIYNDNISLHAATQEQ